MVQDVILHKCKNEHTGDITDAYVPNIVKQKIAVMMGNQESGDQTNPIEFSPSLDPVSYYKSDSSKLVDKLQKSK